jgi:hypothetical protein
VPLAHSVHEELHHAVVEVLAAQVRVAVRRDHLKDPVVDRQQRHVERTTAEVEHEDIHLLLLLLVVQTVRDGRGRRLVDDAHHVQASDRSSVLRRLALSVVEVRRHSHHGVLHRLAEERLRDLLHLLQHHRADLLRRVRLLLALVRHLHARVAVLVAHDVERQQLLVRLHRGVAELTPDQALHRVHRVDGVVRDLVLRAVTHQALRLRERHHRRRDAVTHLVRDDLHRAALPDADHGVRRAEVDAHARRFDAASTAHRRHVARLRGGENACGQYRHDCSML